MALFAEYEDLDPNNLEAIKIRPPNGSTVNREMPDQWETMYVFTRQNKTTSSTKKSIGRKKKYIDD